ncbi:TIGR03943 family putative permease subunit [Salipaludibacillus sp. HK11]|uniref:TIGR03943 family putative permease subunit n=1 Tax=Salipaludibacillus sp. HK11 TaxID=3394320 RepID=UPI0039FD4C7B
MIIHPQQALKAMILLLFCGFLLMLHHTGEINSFINPKYSSFSQVASVLFLLLFFIQASRIFLTKEQAEDHQYCSIVGCSHELDDDKTRKNMIGYVIVCLPLVTGFFLPYSELGAAEALNRGICYSTSETHTGHSHDIPEVSLNDMVHAMIEEPVLIIDNANFATRIQSIQAAPTHFIGKPIKLEGFTFVDESVADGSPILARFIVTHCVADAHVTGLILSSDDEELLEEDIWVRVQGVLDVKHENGQILPIIDVKQWEKTDEQKQPYVYP